VPRRRGRDRDDQGTTAALARRSPAPAWTPSEFGTITRPDGSKQVTYHHHPLCYYAKDEDSEDIYGDGVGGVWHLAKVESDERSSSSGSRY